MKKYEDFSEDNAFFEEKKETSELFSCNRSLVESDYRYSNAADKKGHGFLPLGVMMAAVVLAVVCILIFLVCDKKEEISLVEVPAEVRSVLPTIRFAATFSYSPRPT